MELRNLKLFLDVAATGSFSRAATLAELMQSSVSKAVSRLKAELGARLFDRTGLGALLTEASRALLPRATALLADAQSLSSLMASPLGCQAHSPDAAPPRPTRLRRHEHRISQGFCTSVTTHLPFNAPTLVSCLPWEVAFANSGTAVQFRFASC